MQAWISMATAIPEPIQASDVDSSPSSTHDRFDITYQDQGISQDSSPDQRQHSKRQRSTTKHNNPPSHIPRPSSSTRQVQYESQTVPWTKMLDPDEEKRVAKKWWDSVGRDAMTGGEIDLCRLPRTQ